MYIVQVYMVVYFKRYGIFKIFLINFLSTKKQTHKRKKTEFTQKIK